MRRQTPASHLAANPPERIIIVGGQTGNVFDGGNKRGIEGPFIATVVFDDVLYRFAT
jgi:hypothetical protein